MLVFVSMAVFRASFAARGIAIAEALKSGSFALGMSFIFIGSLPHSRRIGFSLTISYLAHASTAGL